MELNKFNVDEEVVYTKDNKKHTIIGVFMTKDGYSYKLDGIDEKVEENLLKK